MTVVSVANRFARNREPDDVYFDARPDSTVRLRCPYPTEFPDLDPPRPGFDHVVMVVRLRHGARARYTIELPADALTWPWPESELLRLLAAFYDDEPAMAAEAASLEVISAEVAEAAGRM